MGRLRTYMLLTDMVLFSSNCDVLVWPKLNPVRGLVMPLLV